MKKMTKPALIIPAIIVVLIGILCSIIGFYIDSVKKDQAQDYFVDRLYESLDFFPELSQMHNYGEFYFSDGNEEYLFVKNGDSIICAQRNETGSAYYTTASHRNEQYEVIRSMQEAISSRLADEASYTCAKNEGSWQLLVMPESEWVVTCERRNFPGTEFLTYANNDAEESIGWVVYDDDSNIVMYVYLGPKRTNNSNLYVLGWGSVD